MIQTASELPRLPKSITYLYQDHETTSGDPKLASTNPWHHCQIAGTGLTWDDQPGAFYLPFRHRFQESDLTVEQVERFLADVHARSKTWVNASVKYDMHVSKNDLGLDPPEKAKCTTNLARIIDSDRMTRGGYGLGALSVDWLGEDISKYEAALQPYLNRNKDYGNIPADVCGEYGCQDVITVRRLHHYLEANVPEQCRGVWETEQALTPLLYRMERRGLKIDPLQVRLLKVAVLREMLELDGKICERAGADFKPAYGPDCAEVLCNKLGYPVLGVTETGAPSMAKDVLGLYLAEPNVDHELVQWIIEFRRLATFKGLFLDTFENLEIGGYLHTSYNQTVRTGRMSATEPNAQQFDKRAKRLIIPEEGCSFLSCDYSQIEFRLMVHYIEDRDLIAAYQEDPELDFHSWVAQEAGIHRKPAKTVNFAIGYGQGKRNTINGLKRIPELVQELMDQTDSSESFEKLAEKRGMEIFNWYHSKLPGIRLESRGAERAARARGYVYNLYGRRRHLSRERSHIAFNTLNQGTAADLMKERAVDLDKYLDSVGLDLRALVHDEFLMHGPTEIVEDPEVRTEIREILQSPSVELLVPIRIDMKSSSKSWADCD